MFKKSYPIQIKFNLNKPFENGSGSNCIFFQFVHFKYAFERSYIETTYNSKSSKKIQVETEIS